MHPYTMPSGATWRGGRTDNLFKQLDERQLTHDEQTIIQKRVRC